MSQESKSSTSFVNNITKLVLKKYLHFIIIPNHVKFKFQTWINQNN